MNVNSHFNYMAVGCFPNCDVILLLNFSVCFDSQFHVQASFELVVSIVVPPWVTLVPQLCVYFEA